MKTRYAIFLTMGIALLELLLAANSDGAMAPVALVFLNAGMALWAAIDSSKIQLKRYKSGISYGPVVLFFACAMVWIVGFPWYLAVRYKIKNGSAILKDEAPKIAG